MRLSILITQCLQHDFVAPLDDHAPLPNKLHVGAHESKRLLGTDLRVSPVAQLMTWARAQDHDKLIVLHIKDWHDPNDPSQREHLERFGEHCIQGSRGAQLVQDLDQGRAQNERVIHSIALNDFEHTTLGD